MGLTFSPASNYALFQTGNKCYAINNHLRIVWSPDNPNINCLFGWSYNDDLFNQCITSITGKGNLHVCALCTICKSPDIWRLDIVLKELMPSSKILVSKILEILKGKLSNPGLDSFKLVLQAKLSFFPNLLYVVCSSVEQFS